MKPVDLDLIGRLSNISACSELATLYAEISFDELFEDDPTASQSVKVPKGVKVIHHGVSSSSRPGADGGRRRRWIKTGVADKHKLEEVLWRKPGWDGNAKEADVDLQEMRREERASSQQRLAGEFVVGRPALHSPSSLDSQASPAESLFLSRRCAPPAHNPYGLQGGGGAPSGRWVLNRGRPRCVVQDVPTASGGGSGMMNVGPMKPSASTSPKPLEELTIDLDVDVQLHEFSEQTAANGMAGAPKIALTVDSADKSRVRSSSAALRFSGAVHVKVDDEDDDDESDRSRSELADNESPGMARPDTKESFRTKSPLALSCHSYIYSEIESADIKRTHESEKKRTTEAHPDLRPSSTRGRSVAFGSDVDFGSIAEPAEVKIEDMEDILKALEREPKMSTELSRHTKVIRLKSIIRNQRQATRQQLHRTTKGLSAASSRTASKEPCIQANIDTGRASGMQGSGDIGRASGMQGSGGQQDCEKLSAVSGPNYPQESQAVDGEASSSHSSSEDEQDEPDEESCAPRISKKSTINRRGALSTVFTKNSLVTQLAAKRLEQKRKEEERLAALQASKDLKAELKTMKDSLLDSDKATFEQAVWDNCGIQADHLKKQRLALALANDLAAALGKKKADPHVDDYGRRRSRRISRRRSSISKDLTQALAQGDLAARREQATTRNQKVIFKSASTKQKTRQQFDDYWGKLGTPKANETTSPAPRVNVSTLNQAEGKPLFRTPPLAAPASGRASSALAATKLSVKSPAQTPKGFAPSLNSFPSTPIDTPRGSMRS